MPQKAEDLWDCVCDCGNKKIALTSNLKNGSIKSCGCHRIENLAGQKFNKLTVISQAPNIRKSVAWNCLCDCGKKIIVPSTCLKTGGTRSYGCLKKYLNSLTYKDLTGLSFGKLKVISRAFKKGVHGTFWNCLCDCGKITQHSSTQLKSGVIKSCGCSRYDRPSEDLTGMKFGKLSVISRICTENHDNIKWDCLCDCGNKTIVTSGSLKSGTTKSCGCLKKYADKTLHCKNQLFFKYKKSAEIRKIPFEINFEDFISCKLKRI